MEKSLRVDVTIEKIAIFKDGVIIVSEIIVSMLF